jgi:uncharacterized protein (DUF427 family)
MKALWHGAIIAEADDDETIEIEGNQYFPPDSMHNMFLEGSSYTTTCPWKGLAHYYSLNVDGKKNANAAWYYSEPKDGSIEKVGKDFTNYVAFWNGVEIVK